MKKYILASLLLPLFLAAKAQTSGPPDPGGLEEKPTVDTPRFTSVEQLPEFPGGMDAFLTYIAKNLRYPSNAVKNKIQGRVIIAFVVDYDGALTHLTIIKSISPDLDAEAIRLMKNSPKWKPGIQNGRPVRVQYSVPITFNLAN